MTYVGDIGSLVGPQVEVTERILETCRSRGQFGALLFDLYKEAANLVCVSSAAYVEHAGDSVRLERNQAICAGLLVRISKLMISVVKLSADIEHGETIQALNRCITESAVNLRYLLLKDCERVYDRFVRSSLRAERELYDIIHEKIGARDGEQLAIERSMLKSIVETCESSGVTIDEIDRKASGWGGTYRDRIEALGLDSSAYTFLQ